MNANKFPLLEWLGISQPVVVPTPTSSAPIYSDLPMEDEDFREIVEEFISRLHTRIDHLKQLRRAQDWQQIKLTAHWLKGAGGSVGFPILTTLSRELEEAMEAKDTAATNRLLDQLESTIARVEMPPKSESNG